MKLYNWGIIGLGSIAAEFALAFHHDESRLIGAASRSLEKAERFCKTYGIPKAYGSYEEIVADENIDIIYIATPNQQHLDAILLALDHGKHVLCEKAITINQEELQQAMEVAQKNGVILTEAMTVFNMPLYKELRNRVDGGAFGQLKMIQVSFGSFKEPDPTNRFFNPDLAGGALLDIGTYALSFARFFLSSQPVILSSIMKPFETGVDEQSVTIMKNQEDEMATVALTFQSKMPKQGIVAFEDAFITIDDFPRADKAHITFLDGTTETLVSGESSQAMNYEVHNMVETVKGKTPNASLFYTNEVLHLMDQMRTSWNSQ